MAYFLLIINLHLWSLEHSPMTPIMQLKNKQLGSSQTQTASQEFNLIFRTKMSSILTQNEPNLKMKNKRPWWSKCSHFMSRLTLWITYKEWMRFWLLLCLTILNVLIWMKSRFLTFSQDLCMYFCLRFTVIRIS